MNSKKIPSLKVLSVIKIFLSLILAVGMSILPIFGSGAALAQGGLSINTSFPGVTVKPGESLSFPLSIDNATSLVQNAELSIKSIPKGWVGYFEGMGKTVNRVLVKKQGSQIVDFKVTVPAETSEGSYPIIIGAFGTDSNDTLVLDIKVSKGSMSQSQFISQYPELQGSGTASFKFRVDLTNNSSKDQSFSLGAKLPSGWEISFTPSFEDKQIASISLGPEKSKGIDIEVKPPKTVTAGKYPIPVAAISAQELITTELSVIITGTYDMSLTTPTGRLTTEATAGIETPISLTITNKGSAALKNVSFAANPPLNWTVRFDPGMLQTLAAGQTQAITAYIKPDSRAIAGDYSIKLFSATPETISNVDFRVTVKTPTTWGFVGVAIILLLLGGLYWIFKVYGRR